MQGKSPRVGFVSLGCPKALVDSERILTQLRIRGYEISPSYETADLVVVNTCGFIDSAIDESLEAIGEALEANGKVIVTGCLGANPQRIRDQHPKVLAVTGPHATDQVLEAVNLHLPRPHDPFNDLVPAQGIRLTPRHYAYLKISEGCNNKCSFCIIPSLRGLLASRPLADVMQEAETPGGGRREGAAGDLAGHQRLRRRPALSGNHAARRSNTRPVSSTWRARWARWASGCACTMSTPIRMSTTCCR